jgi:hypothetical protein
MIARTIGWMNVSLSTPPTPSRPWPVHHLVLRLAKRAGGAFDFERAFTEDAVQLEQAVDA